MCLKPKHIGNCGDCLEIVSFSLYVIRCYYYSKQFVVELLTEECLGGLWSKAMNAYSHATFLKCIILQ